MKTFIYPGVITRAATVSEFWHAARLSGGAKEVEIASDDPRDRLACLASDCTEWAIDDRTELILPQGVAALHREIELLFSCARHCAQVHAKYDSRRARITVALTREGDHLLSWMALV